MSSRYQSELPPKIYAEAVVRSASGESLLRSPRQVTSDNVMFFHATSDQRLLAAKRLRAEGFEVLDIGSASVNIAAPPEVYERALGANLELIERPIVGDTEHQGIASYINSVDQTPFGEIDISDQSWNDLLDGVAINEPAYYLQHVVPSATPPQTNTRYLQVPNDLAEELNASLAHAKGVTGEGVQVVAIDSGCYVDHPFFKRHNYNLNVVLGPGSSDPDLDANGHGTGIAANVFAIAPNANLTILKADIALKNKYRNVNSAAAFRKAISLRPDVISCSWGTDLRSPFQLSAYHKVLAAAIADAVRQGIVVIFAAGNGQWGFPSQHPDVLAVGGVYKHLEGSLEGRLEASNYASSFISAIYPGRRVPDICGLVGQLPNAAYIMLPVPPGSQTDSSRAATGDETEKADGWAAFSGTSSAAPQLAGACALLEQYVPGLGPLKIKQLLQETAEDILEGSSHPASGSGGARAGPDLATGYGLAVAHKAIEAAKASVPGRRTLSSVSFLQNAQTSMAEKPLMIEGNTFADYTRSQYYDQSFSQLPRSRSMYSQFPKVKANLEEISWKLEEALKEVIKNYDIEDVELRINETIFAERSTISRIASSFRETLNSCFDKRGKVKSSAIQEKHISAAQVLIKLGRYQEAALKVLSHALTLSFDELVDCQEYKMIKDLGYDRIREVDRLFKENPNASTYSIQIEGKPKSYTPDEVKQITKQGKAITETLDNLSKKASEALSECGSEITSFDTNKEVSSPSFLDGPYCDNGKEYYTYNDKKEYTGRSC